MLEFQSIVESDLLTKRSIEQLSRLSGRIVMLDHRNRLPGHFEPQAVGRYGYAKRTNRYMIQKARKHGHQNPLMFTGGLRTAILANAKVTATKDRATLRSKGNKQHQLQPQYRRELEAITPQEHAEMVSLYQHVFVQQAQQPQYKKKSRRDATGRFTAITEPSN